MKKKLIVKYISIIVLFTSFMMGSFHHHADIEEHNDCKICILQHNITDIDTPVDVSYLTLFFLDSEATVSRLQSLQTQEYFSTFSARAPPLYT